MASPFPGMDPYIEDPDLWTDFHSGLAYEIRTELNRKIQPRYVAKVIPRVTYEAVEIGAARGILPDIAVWERKAQETPAAYATAAVTEAPVESTVSIEFETRVFAVEIHEVGTLRLVTAIEILSPANKRPGHDAFEDYKRKRRDLLRSPVHLIEVDLLRGGTRPPLDRPVPAAPYYVTLSRVEKRPLVSVWPLQLQDRLPVLPVPLLEPDPDATLDLGAMVSAVYERGAYQLLINYQQPPPPPLDASQQEWLNTFLYEKGLRPDS